MFVKLTKTEDQIVRLKMQGFQRKEIANQMHRSLDTVSVHFRHIYEKTDVDNEIELYNWYCENVFHISIRKMLQVIVLVLILIPSIFSRSDTIQRAMRARTSSRTQGNSRKGESDSTLESFLFN